MAEKRKIKKPAAAAPKEGLLNNQFFKYDQGWKGWLVMKTAAIHLAISVLELGNMLKKINQS